MQPRDELYARNQRFLPGLKRDVIGVPSGINYSRWRGNRNIFANDSSSSEGKNSSDFSDAGWSLDTPRSSITSIDSDIYGNQEPLNVPRVREETDTNEAVNVEIVEGVPMTGDLSGNTKIPEIEAEDIRNIPPEGLPESAHEARIKKNIHYPPLPQHVQMPRTLPRLAPDNRPPIDPNRAELEAPAHSQPTSGPVRAQMSLGSRATSTTHQNASNSVPLRSSPLRNEPKAETEVATLKAGETNIPEQAPSPVVPNGLTPPSHESSKGLLSRAIGKIEHVFELPSHTSSPATNGHANGSTDDKIATSRVQYPTRVSPTSTDSPTSTSSPIFDSPPSSSSNDSTTDNPNSKGHTHTHSKGLLARVFDKIESAILDDGSNSSELAKNDSASSGSDPDMIAPAKDSAEHTINHPDRPGRKRKKTVSFSTNDHVIMVKD